MSSTAGEARDVHHQLAAMAIPTAILLPAPTGRLNLDLEGTIAATPRSKTASDGFKVGRDLDKLGLPWIPAEPYSRTTASRRKPGGRRGGRGFGQVMSGLETGRINVAARAVGVAQAAFEAAIRYSQQRETFGVPISQHQAIQLKLADMATKIQAARLLTYDAAAKKDSGARVDLESGMAKLYASEICGEVAMDSMRIHGGYGYIKESPVERYYRDAPLMIIGEGTNEVLRLVIARQLLRRP